MAATAEGAQLTVEHYQRQQALAAVTLRDSLRLFPILDASDLDRTVGDWLSLHETLIETRRRVSEALAGDYLQRFRSVEFGRGAAPIVTAPFDVNEARAALLITGVRPLRLGDATRNIANARVGAARSSSRLVLNGGRGLIDKSVTADRRAHGWARVTGGKPCAWCAMQASRGPVFGSEQTAGFRAHDSCACTAEPVYRSSAAWPGRAREYRDLWDSTTRGLSGDGALNAFRAAFTT